METDSYRYRWIVLTDPQLDDLVALIHLAAQELQSHGYGPQLLAAVFRFTTPDRPAAYLIYNYKRGAFYPFAPPGPARTGRATWSSSSKRPWRKRCPSNPTSPAGTPCGACLSEPSQRRQNPPTPTPSATRPTARLRPPFRGGQRS